MMNHNTLQVIRSNTNKTKVGSKKTNMNGQFRNIFSYRLFNHLFLISSSLFLTVSMAQAADKAPILNFNDRIFPEIGINGMVATQ